MVTVKRGSYEINKPTKIECHGTVQAVSIDEQGKRKSLWFYLKGAPDPVKEVKDFRTQIKLEIFEGEAVLSPIAD